LEVVTEKISENDFIGSGWQGFPCCRNRDLRKINCCHPVTGSMKRIDRSVILTATGNQNFAARLERSNEISQTRGNAVQLPWRRPADVPLRPEFRLRAVSFVLFLAQNIPSVKSSVRTRNCLERQTPGCQARHDVLKERRMRLRVNCRRFYLLAAWLVISNNLCAQQVQGLDAIRVASGLSSPLFVTAPPGDFNRSDPVTRFRKRQSPSKATDRIATVSVGALK
jgi:hypothetical protein